MLFSSQPFLFFFLPLLLIAYFLLLRDIRKRNILLFFASLFFYAWGEPWFVLVMLFSIVVNWFLGRFCEKRTPDDARARRCFWLAVFFNIALLFVFKYLGFVTRNAALLFATSSDIDIALPIGISFFTFQELSYIVDIYKAKTKPFRNFLDTGLYVAFFPQLIAGPIIRFDNFAPQLLQRRESIDKFISGAELFCIGLAKKILLANTFGRLADLTFGMEAAELTAPFAWLGALAYTFQIYFDFSGYSDMAIGLARMFGFEFPANFNYPYISRSISEFWRRWHISLGSFFRDYVYFPLGGSRVDSKWRQVFNLFVVWTLTGIWHGANWTFILWGLFFFILITLEKLFENVTCPRPLIPLQWLTVFVLLILGWVLFRAESLTEAVDYLGAMFRPEAWHVNRAFLNHLTEYLPEFIIGAIASTPLMPWLRKHLPQWSIARPLLKHAWLVLIFLLSLGALEASSFNPFIYFNF